MLDYLTVLRDRITAHPPDLGGTDSVLNLLYEAYSEMDPMEDDHTAGEDGRDHQPCVFPVPGT